MRYFLITAVLALSACGTTLTAEGEKVRIVTEQQRAGCKFIKLVTVTKGLGLDKPGNALKDAMNEVAAAGGNGLFLVTNSVHWADGASVAGEALSCTALTQ